MLPATIYDVLAYVLIGFSIMSAIIFLVMMIPVIGEASSRRPQTARPPKRVCIYTGPCWSTEDMRRFRNDMGDYLVRKYYEDLRKEREKQLYASMLEELCKK